MLPVPRKITSRDCLVSNAFSRSASSVVVCFGIAVALCLLVPQILFAADAVNARPNIVFLMTDEDNFYVSSSLVREVARFSGDVSAFVPPSIERALKVKFAT